MRREMATSEKSTGIFPSSLLRKRVASAKPERERFSEPEKITSSAFLPRSSLRLCSPSTQRMASATFDFPEPFGPTTAVMPLVVAEGVRKSNSAFSANDLKPTSSSFWRCIFLTKCTYAALMMQKTKEPGYGRERTYWRPAPSGQVSFLLLSLVFRSSFSVHWSKKRPLFSRGQRTVTPFSAMNDLMVEAVT